MKLNKQCEYCGDMIQYDTYYDKYGDGAPVVHIVTKRKTHLLFHRECIAKIGASGAMSLAK